MGYLLREKEQDVSGKHTRSQCNNTLRPHSPSFHYWLRVSFLFFFHTHSQLLGRIRRKPSAVVTSVTFPVSQQGWAAAEISSLMFSRHLCCSSPADIIRGLMPTPPDSSWSYSSQKACALLPPLSEEGSCSALFNCFRKWQLVWYRRELWNSNLHTDAHVGKHSSASPTVVVWRCSHLSSSQLHLALTAGLCPFGWIRATQAVNLMFGMREVMRRLFGGAGARGGARWLAGNSPRSFSATSDLLSRHVLQFCLLLHVREDKWRSRSR